jgi:hypothetical protein
VANLENRGLVTPGDGAGIGEEPELKGVLMAIETSPLATGPSDRPPGRNAPRRWPWLLGLLILALVTAAIAFVVTEPSGDKTVEAGSAAATVSDDVLVNAYVAAFLASDAIATNPKVSPNDPSLDAVVSEPLLGFVRSQLAGFRSQGLVYEPGGLAHSNTHVVEKGSDRAVLRSCLVEKGYATVNGERRPAPGPPGTRTAMEAIAVRDAASGVWKISSRYPNSGGRECDGA